MVDIEPAVQWALGQVGTPYVSVGGATPGVNLDCSGLVMLAYKQVDINMPHSTYLQIKYGVGVGKSELVRGDLVFPDPGHVQIYLGNGMIVESPHPGARVRVVKMWGFYAGRRLGFAPPPKDRSPFSSLDKIGEVFGSAEKSAKWLSNSHNWYRVLLVAFGTVLLVVAFRMLLQTEMLTLTKKVTDAL